MMKFILKRYFELLLLSTFMVPCLWWLQSHNLNLPMMFGLYFVVTSDDKHISCPYSIDFFFPFHNVARTFHFETLTLMSSCVLAERHTLSGGRRTRRWLRWWCLDPQSKWRHRWNVGEICYIFNSGDARFFSCRLLFEDNDSGLYSVTLFMKAVDDFKHKARENKWEMFHLVWTSLAQKNLRISISKINHI